MSSTTTASSMAIRARLPRAMRSFTRSRRRLAILAGLGIVVLGGAIAWKEYPHKSPLPVPIPSRYPQSTLAMRSPGRLRVLFLGNSLTEYNGGLATTMEQLAASAKLKPMPVFDELTKFGATWAQLWDVTRAREEIKQGNWDYIVLQDYSTAAMIYPSEMQVYGRRFGNLSKSVGARPVYFMTWPHQDQPQTLQPIAAAYVGVAADNHGIVAPVGWAWKTVLRDHPELILYDPRDKPAKHPTPAGTYLTACVFYSMFFNASPHGLTGRIAEGTNVYIDLSPTVAHYLQDVAWNTVHGPLTTTRPAQNIKAQDIKPQNKPQDSNTQKVRTNTASVKHGNAS